MADISTLVDDFEDGVFDTAKWYRSATTILEQNGRIEIEANGDQFFSILGVNWYPDAVYLKIGNGDFIVRYESPPNSDKGYYFRKSGSSLQGGTWTGSFGGESSVTYNATTMAYLQFRSAGAGGNMELEYSADAITWTRLGVFYPPTQPGVSLASGFRLRILSGGGTTYLESVNVVPTAPPTTVTLTGAMTATALAVIPDSVGPVAVTTVTLLGPFGWYPPQEFLPGRPFTTGWQFFRSFEGVPSFQWLRVVLRAEPPAMTATALAPAPVVSGGPLPTTVVSPVATATTSVLAPAPLIRAEAPAMSASGTAVAPALPILVVADVAQSNAEFPTPAVTGVTTFDVETMHVAARFPSPINAGEYGYPNAKTGRASAIMYAPRRYGPPQPSIYKEMVERVTPANIANFSMDEHSGEPIIVGDPQGKSLVLDGIDDQLPIEVSAHREHTMVLWFVCDPTDTGVSRIWQQSIPEGFGNLLFLEVLASNGGLMLNSTADLSIGGPFVRDGLPHMVMLTSRIRTESDHEVADEIKMYCDGVLVGTDDWIVQWVGGILGYQLKGRIDEVTFWDKPLQPEWATELWWQGTGTGGSPTSVAAPACTSTTRLPTPSLSIRPVLDSWQLHDDFEGDELNPELWTVGYQGMLQAEGPGGPAPSQPLTEVPFVLDGEMTLRAGTIVSSRDWMSYGEWVARIEMLPIESDSDVIVGIAVFAAYAEGEGRYEYGSFHETHEEQMSWNSYISTNGRRYTYRGWSVYSPEWDDAGGYEIEVYDPHTDDVVIITSPHQRAGQNITHADSADYQFPGGMASEGFVPYWPMEKPYNNPYEARLLRLVIQVTGSLGSSIVITGINVTPPTTKIVIPTAQLAADVETVTDHTYCRPYEGVKGPRSIKPPTIRTTGRFPKPNERASLYVENTMSVEWSDFLFPEWGGPARPVTNFSPKASAYALFIEPILFGEPVDVVIEATTSGGAARALAPNTSGTIKKAFGITRSETRKMAIRIEYTKMDLSIGHRELVSA